MCQSVVGSKTYMAPEVLNRRSAMYYDPDRGYDGAKVRVLNVPRNTNTRVRGGTSKPTRKGALFTRDLIRRC